VIPNVPLEGRTILDKDLSHVDKITLNSTNNNLNFLFSPRDYDLPFKVEYYYRLDSSKNEWHPIVGNNVELMNLSPGRYHLEVCAMSPEGLMSSEVDGVDIEILSPWYLTAWAYVVYLVLLFVILIMVIYYFIDRQKQKLTMAQTEKEMDRQRQLNDMKLQFFTNISHDFRTPLSLIITPLEAYLGSHSDSETRHFLKPVHKNALQLLNLVNQILDFRKLDVTGVPLHLSYGDVVSYVKEICASFNLFSEDSGIKLEVKTSTESLNMYFDKDKLGKIMMNLLSNAFKYNNEGGKVTISIDTDGDTVKISVGDTGRGIPDADKERIFDRFFQSGNRQHTAMGCGIGLHIVKEFVQLHGGTVEVKDNEPQGTMFVVTLPVVKTIETEKPQDTPETPATESRALLPASDKPVAESRATILLVEDNQDFIDFMEQSLVDDYNVLKASNGEQALQVLDSETVDIIISDVMMDRMDGLELCKAVKSDIRISHVPVILLTAKSLAEDEMRGLESGADDYITKPFSMPILRQRISKLIDENRRSQEKFRRIPDISPSEITITPLDEKFLSDTIKVVEENMSNPDFYVEMLSANLGMHRTHLYKK
ncbi:MAG: response regulator, partial [Muribaculaceae bacterium]|nr:response regulator [Muribaculaceae bacterium]